MKICPAHFVSQGLQPVLLSISQITQLIRACGFTKIQEKLQNDVQSDTKKRELLKNPTKIEEIQEKKIIDRN